MIKIDDDFYVKAEGLDYSAYVYVDGINNKTKEATRNAKLVGYYPSILKALEGIRSYKVHNSMSDGIKSLDEAISLIRECDERLIESLKKWEGKK